MSTFLDVVSKSYKGDLRSVKGYSLDEIDKIERLYDIKIAGDLKSFFLDMGRNSGGMISDNSLILYRPTWSVRTQIKYQLGFIDLMQEDGQFAYLTAKPFVFACESETQYFFLQTELSDEVMQYDENNGHVQKTDKRFAQYLSDLVASESDLGFGQVCQGELLIV